jgi:hypothetical protein
MASVSTDVDTTTAALSLLDELVSYQRKKVGEIARRIHPSLTDEEIRRIRDFPDVTQDPTFQFEDGQLAGLVTAQIALRARLRASTLPSR